MDEMLTLSDYKIDDLLSHRVDNDLGGFPQGIAKEAEYFAKKKQMAIRKALKLHPFNY